MRIESEKECMYVFIVVLETVMKRFGTYYCANQKKNSTVDHLFSLDFQHWLKKLSTPHCIGIVTDSER
jgi:hypothetical protein